MLEEQQDGEFVAPDGDEIRNVAKTLGIEVSAAEAEVFRTRLAGSLQRLDEFLRAPVEEVSPPGVTKRRLSGYSPAPSEDPFNAWLWKCSINGSGRGVLARKTVCFKDTIAVAGVPLTCGQIGMEDFAPDFDATVVTRTLEAGAAVIGKTAIAGGFGEGNDDTRPRNPHAPAHLTGGTSSGAVVAVVTGDADISFGGDQGGSVRIPAAWSGAVGLKPTFGLISHFGVVTGSDQSVDHVGPITRYVEDAAAALQAVAGYDALDPRQSAGIPHRFNALTSLSDGVEGLRIGVLEQGFVGAEPDVAELVHVAVDVLRKAGARVTTVSIPEHLQVALPYLALAVESSRALAETGPFGMFAKTYYPSSLIAAVTRSWTMQQNVHPDAKLGRLLAELSRRAYGGRLYGKAQNARRAFVRAYDHALADVDLLAMPTCVHKAPRYSSASELQTHHQTPLESAVGMSALQNTLPFNYTGHPALAVPCGKSGGLPVSLQLVGRFLDDHVLLRAAYTYEHGVDYDDIIALDASR